MVKYVGRKCGGRSDEAGVATGVANEEIHSSAEHSVIDQREGLQRVATIIVQGHNDLTIVRQVGETGIVDPPFHGETTGLIEIEGGHIAKVHAVIHAVEAESRADLAGREGGAVFESTVVAVGA